MSGGISLRVVGDIISDRRLAVLLLGLVLGMLLLVLNGIQLHNIFIAALSLLTTQDNPIYIAILPNQELSVLYGGPTLNYGGQLSLYVPYMLRVNMTGDLAHLQLSDLQGETRPVCRTSDLQGERMLICRT